MAPKAGGPPELRNWRLRFATYACTCLYGTVCRCHCTRDDAALSGQAIRSGGSLAIRNEQRGMGTLRRSVSPVVPAANAAQAVITAADPAQAIVTATDPT